LLTRPRDSCGQEEINGDEESKGNEGKTKDKGQAEKQRQSAEDLTWTQRKREAIIMYLLSSSSKDEVEVKKYS
jgi:hypothetical protein